MIVAKITQEIAESILGTVSIDGIRLFNPVNDILGNYLMDLQMAIDNQINYTEFTLDTLYYDELQRKQDEINNESTI